MIIRIHRTVNRAINQLNFACLTIEINRNAVCGTLIQRSVCIIQLNCFGSAVILNIQRSLGYRNITHMGSIADV